MAYAPRIRRRIGPLVVMAGLALVAAGCSSSGSAGERSNGPTGIGSAATAVDPSSPPATTPETPAAPPATPTAPPTTVTPEPVGLPDAAAAATKLYDAWVAGDRAAAATIAEPAAIEAIFGATPGSYELYRGCDSGEFDTGGCLFRDRSNNNTIQVDVERRDSGWVVSGAFFSAD